MTDDKKHAEDTTPVTVLDTEHPAEQTATVVEPVEHTELVSPEPVTADPVASEPVEREAVPPTEADLAQPAVPETPVLETVVPETPVSESTVDNEDRLADTRFFAVDDVDSYRTDWRAVQAGFVEDPDGAIRAADDLITRVVDTFAAGIAARRVALSGPQEGEDDDRTEAQRLTLRRYRTLFEQLLTVDPS
jgi:hypothetical protein